MEGIKRDLFPIVGEKPYFNACSIGPLSIPVKEATENYLHQWNDYGGFAWVKEDGWNNAVENARALFAKIIGADVENVAYSFGNSVAFSAVMSGFEFSSKDNIIFNELDFPAFPARIMAQSEFDIEYKVVNSEEGLVHPHSYEDVIDDNTKMVTVCEVSSNTGARINIKALTEISHQNDTPIFVDSYQSTGVIPMDVKELDVDFLASGCLKWLVGGFGISFLYIRDDWIDKLNPSSIGWMGVDQPFEDLYDKLRTSLHRPNTALKFQHGTPYPFGAVSAAAGMKLVDKIGISKIYDHDQKITQEIIDKAHNNGYQVQTSEEPEHRGSIVNVKIKNATEIVSRLQESGFILDMRSNGIRLAPHFYNNSDDIEKLFAKIKELESVV